MAAGNGDVKPSEDVTTLIGLGVNDKVAEKLAEIYATGKLTHAELDERALDALKEFPADNAITMLKQFAESNLEHVSNKSAYLCGVMKTFRQKNKAAATPAGGAPAASAPGPDEAKLKEILDRTGYSLDVTTGQRKYGGPPPNWEGKQPGAGCEVFVGKVPRDVFEDELIPLFETVGTIWDLRIMMDPMTGSNRGFAFVTFTDKESAKKAVTQIDNHEIKKGKSLKVNISVPNLRLFVGNIPKSKSKEEIQQEFSKHTEDLQDVIIYSSPDDRKKNRGFCFLEYETHKAASLAKRKLSSGRCKVWNCDVIVDWADPQEEPDSETMAKVKVLYARNLTQDCTEEKLKEAFEVHGKVERVKKIKDYAFIHFEEREHALKAMEALNGTTLCGSTMDVSLAKPPSDKKKKEEMLRNRERRMMDMMAHRGGPMFGPPMGGPMRGFGGRGAPRGARGGGGGGYHPQQYADYEVDYDYDSYGYGDYRGGYSDPAYDDYYTEDFSYEYAAPPAPRGRARGAMAGRARAAPAGRGRAGGPPRGAGGLSVRGAPGARGASRGMRSRGASAMGGAPRGAGVRGTPGKRKFEGGHQNPGDNKRRPTAGSWGSAPIPQQPLRGGRGGGYGYAQDDFYSDSYDQGW